VTIVIPAAGIGSRFLPTSRAVPKELLPLGLKPLIHHALEEAERAGFTMAVVVLSPNKAAIRSYFEREPSLERALEARGDGPGLAMLREASAIAERLNVRFVEQPLPRGLGDAVLRCRPVAGDNFAVLLPDDVVVGSGHWHPLLRLLDETGAACFSVRAVGLEQAHRFGIAVCEPMDGRLRVKQVTEKPARGTARSDLAIFGRYIVTEPVLDALQAMLGRAATELELTDGFAAVLHRPPGVFAELFTAEFFDNGTPEEYARSVVRYAAGALDQWSVRELARQRLVSSQPKSG
jgi:UTP--glucose-1-phosphate uridylyltransferase